MAHRGPEELHREAPIHARGDSDEPPPILRTWARLYGAVLAWLAFLILVFYLFARRFAP